MTDSIRDNDIQEGWAVARVRDVFEVNPRKPAPDLLPPDAPVSFVPMSSVSAYSGTIESTETRAYATVRNGYTSFADNDVIFAKITPCMENGKAAIAKDLTNGLGSGSSEFHVFRPTGQAIPQFLFHYVRQESFRQEAKRHMAGTSGHLRVPPEFVSEYELPLPPLAEQKRIVAKVEELLERVNTSRAHLAKVPTLLKRFRQSVLAAACSGRLTQD